MPNHTNSPIDWPAIRAKYAAGMSQRTLAREYGVSQPAISERAKKEGWQKSFSFINPVITPASDLITDKPPETISEIIETLLKKVIEHAQHDLEIKDIKLLADAVSQFHKIQLTSASDKPTESGLPANLLGYLTADELNQIGGWQTNIEAMLDIAKARQLEAEQGIKTIRGKKVG